MHEKDHADLWQTLKGTAAELTQSRSKLADPIGPANIYPLDTTTLVVRFSSSLVPAEYLIAELERAHMRAYAPQFGIFGAASEIIADDIPAAHVRRLYGFGRETEIWSRSDAVRAVRRRQGSPRGMR